MDPTWDFIYWLCVGAIVYGVFATCVLACMQSQVNELRRRETARRETESSEPHPFWGE